jgi:hypothetical protein
MTIRPAMTYHPSASVQRDTSRGYIANVGVQPYGVGLPYVGDTRCAANEGTCGAARVKGSELCIGHLRQLKKQLEVADEQE